MSRGSFSIFAFSDWRVQNIEDIFTFLRIQAISPDIIVYSGDDIGRFLDAEGMHALLQRREH
jgi:hypothetical protein